MSTNCYHYSILMSMAIKNSVSGMNYAWNSNLFSLITFRDMNSFVMFIDDFETISIKIKQNWESLSFEIPNIFGIHYFGSFVTIVVGKIYPIF